jgi:hypothetical protein
VRSRPQAAFLGVLAAIVLAGLAAGAWRYATHEPITDQVTVSVDGARWTAHLEDAFFSSEEPWSPGQTRTAILWVRNDADLPAYVDLHVAAVEGQDLTRSGVLEISAVVGDGDDVQPFVADRDTNTVRIDVLDEGERETVTLRAVHAGEVALDSAALRHRLSGSGIAAEDPRSPLDASEARLELAPLFLTVALLVTLLVMYRTRRPRARSTRRP